MSMQCVGTVLNLHFALYLFTMQHYLQTMEILSILLLLLYPVRATSLHTELTEYTYLLVQKHYNSILYIWIKMNHLLRI